MKTELGVFVAMIVDAILAYYILRFIPASWLGLLLFIGTVSIAFMALMFLFDSKERSE